MKRVLIVFLSGFITWSGFSQNSSVDKLFDKYSGKDGFTVVNISKEMFDMFGQMNNQGDDQEFKDVASKLTGIRILSYEGKDDKGINFYKELMKDFPANEYKELMVIKEKDQDVKFLTREKNGKIIELILIAGGKDNTLICIDGDINLKDISKITQSMQIQGMDKLDKTDK